jgi:hypothetical protein
MLRKEVNKSTCPTYKPLNVTALNCNQNNGVPRFHRDVGSNKQYAGQGFLCFSQAVLSQR